MSPIPDHAVAIRAFDYLAACAFGVVAALAAWQVVPDSIGVMPSMLLGMIAGVVTAIPVLLVLASILGGFELIILSMQVGMFAGMTGAMTSSIRWADIAWQGAIVGLLIQVLLHVTDRSLRGEV